VARILLVTSEMAGRINVTCELAHRLRTAGHEPTIACPVDISARIAELGMTFTRIGAAASRHPDSADPPSRITGRLAAFLRRLGGLRHLAANRTARVDALEPEGLVASMRTLAPDLALIDIELPVPVMAAWAAGVPVVLWTTMLSVWRRPGLPPLGSAITPGVGRSGSRIGIALAWLRFRTWKWLRMQRLRITRMGTDQISVLRRVAARTGFPFDEETARYEWLLPFTYRTLPVLSFNAFELEFPHDPQPTCRYVGPVLNPRRRTTPDPDIDRSLEAIYGRRSADPSRRLIYCAFGAWHKGDDRDFVRRVIEAVATRPDWDLVAGLGDRIDPSSLGEVPGNVHLLRWAPQLEVLGNADVAIHHAGIGSVNECIASGVPMVLYPFDFLDQPGNAARVAFHGIGEVGDRRSDSADVIRERLERMLGDGDVRRRVEQMRTVLLGYETDNRALDEIERLLSDSG